MFECFPYNQTADNYLSKRIGWQDQLLGISTVEQKEVKPSQSAEMALSPEVFGADHLSFVSIRMQGASENGCSPKLPSVPIKNDNSDEHLQSMS